MYGTLNVPFQGAVSRIDLAAHVELSVETIFNKQSESCTKQTVLGT